MSNIVSKIFGDKKYVDSLDKTIDQSFKNINSASIKRFTKNGNVVGCVNIAGNNQVFSSLPILNPTGVLVESPIQLKSILECDLPFIITYEAGDEDSIILDEALLPFVKDGLSKGVLQLNKNSNLMSFSLFSITVRAKNPIKNLVIKGSTIFSSSYLDENANILHEGNGKVKLSSNIVLKNIKTTIKGSGKFILKAAISDLVEISQEGSSKIDISSERSLNNIKAITTGNGRLVIKALQLNIYI